MTAAPGPLVDHVDWIVAMDADAVRRNLLITQCYHDLSDGLGRVLDGENANWCTFASWASKTAGRFIRDDEVPALLRGLLGRADPVTITFTRVSDALRRLDAEADEPHRNPIALARSIVGAVAEVIAAGNLAVYGELAPVFARVIRAWEAGDEAAFDAVLDGLRPGTSAQGGQALLRTALVHYREARAAADPHRRAQLMLLANAQVGLHEQTRLQPYIAASIDAPVREAIDEHLDTVTEHLPGAMRQRAYARLEAIIAPVAEGIEDAWEELCTRELMTLSLPDGELMLGRDLPAPPGQPLYPQLLEQIDDPELVDLLEAYGADHPTAEGSAAVDWTRLGDRMRYIIDLFRSRQREGALRGEPFTADQREAILAGRPPAGSLG